MHVEFSAFSARRVDKSKRFMRKSVLFYLLFHEKKSTRLRLCPCPLSLVLCPLSFVFAFLFLFLFLFALCLWPLSLSLSSLSLSLCSSCGGSSSRPKKAKELKEYPTRPHETNKTTRDQTMSCREKHDKRAHFFSWNAWIYPRVEANAENSTCIFARKAL